MSTGRPNSVDDAEPELRRRAKALLRDALRKQRLALPIEARRTRALALAEQLRDLPELRDATTVLSYVRIKGEVDVAPSLALHPHLAVALPRVEGDDLTLHIARSTDDFETSMWGVPEPKAEVPQIAHAAIDVVLVPAVALDPRGYRLGWGGGFYDRLLPKLPNARFIGVGYDFQLVPELPDEPFDVPVHVIATDLRVLRPG